MPRLDMSALLRDLDHLEQLAEKLHDTEASDSVDSKPTHAERREIASMNRELLMLADRLDQHASIIRAQYWAAKGYQPLSAGAPDRRPCTKDDGAQLVEVQHV